MNFFKVLLKLCRNSIEIFLNTEPRFPLYNIAYNPILYRIVMTCEFFLFLKRKSFLKQRKCYVARKCCRNWNFRKVKFLNLSSLQKYLFLKKITPSAAKGQNLDYQAWFGRRLMHPLRERKIAIFDAILARADIRFSATPFGKSRLFSLSKPWPDALWPDNNRPQPSTRADRGAKF